MLRTAFHTLPEFKSLETSFCLLTGNHVEYGLRYLPANRFDARFGTFIYSFIGK
jgi:hypothetical protein